MAVNPTALLRRSPRVRRDPIDISLVAAEAAEAAETDPSLDAGEVLAALEAEVGRVASLRATVPVAPEPVVVTAPNAGSTPVPPRAPAAIPHVGMPGAGISPDQVRAWMQQVQDDLRKVRARVEYLRVEQARLDEQQRLMAQLLTSSTPL
jgi:hypothetical protein